MPEPAIGVIIYRTKNAEFQLDGHSGDVLVAFPFVENGTAIDYYPTGQIRYAITYQDGIRHGRFVHHSEDSVEVTEKTYVQGRETGVQRVSSPQGIWEALVLNDEVQSACTMSPEGRLLSEFPYENGLCHGNVVHYDPAGRVCRIDPFVKGKQEGWSTEYLAQGQVSTRQLFKDDKPVGPKKFFNNGYCVRDVFYAAGDDSTWVKTVDYDAAGRKTMMKCVEGYMHQYDYEGRTVREIVMDKDYEPHGPETMYDMDAYGDPVLKTGRTNKAGFYVHGAYFDLTDTKSRHKENNLIFNAMQAVEQDSRFEPYQENRMQVISPADQVLDEEKLYSLMAQKPFWN